MTDNPIPGTTFVRDYRAAATQLRTLVIALDWWRLHQRLHPAGIYVGPGEAAAWADLGFYPGEAEPHITTGMSAAMYREAEDHAEAQAGGRDALAAQRIAHMLDTGQLVREDQVVRIPDPTDPDVEIVVVRDDIG